MGEGDEVSGPPRAITDDHGNRGRVSHIFQDRPDRVCATLDDEADQRRGEVRREPLRRDEPLELPPERDLGAVLADGGVVHEEEVGVVLVQGHEARPATERSRNSMQRQRQRRRQRRSMTK